MTDVEFRKRAHALLMRLGHVGMCVECGRSPFGFRGYLIPGPAEEVAALRKAGASQRRGGERERRKRAARRPS